MGEVLCEPLSIKLSFFENSIKVILLSAGEDLAAV